MAFIKYSRPYRWLARLFRHRCRYQYVPCFKCHGLGHDQYNGPTSGNWCHDCGGKGHVLRCAQCDAEALKFR